MAVEAFGVEKEFLYELLRQVGERNVAGCRTSDVAGCGRTPHPRPARFDLPEIPRRHAYAAAHQRRRPVQGTARRGRGDTGIRPGRSACPGRIAAPHLAVSVSHVHQPVDPYDVRNVLPDQFRAAISATRALPVAVHRSERSTTNSVRPSCPGFRTAAAAHRHRPPGSELLTRVAELSGPPGRAPRRSRRRGQPVGGVQLGMPLVDPRLELGEPGDQRDQAVVGPALRLPLGDDPPEHKRLLGRGPSPPSPGARSARYPGRRRGRR